MKHTFRLVPCSIYENEIMESWLEDSALQGLVLENISYGVAKFRKQKPQKLRYRLSVIPAERWDVYENVPGKEQLIDICESSGWQFICQRGQFGIFVTADETVEELHTEPKLQYLDFKDYIDWRILLGRAVILLSVCYVAWIAFIRDGFFTIWAQQDSVLFTAVLMVLLVTIMIDIRELFCPIFMYQKLKRNGITHERKNWQGYALCYRLLFAAVIFLYIGGLGYMFYYLLSH